MFGFGNKNMMINSGSYFLIQSLMFANFLVSKLIQKICKANAENETARKIGTFFFTPNAFQRLWNAYLKLFMETYFDFCFGVVLNSVAFAEAI